MTDPAAVLAECWRPTVLQSPAERNRIVTCRWCGSVKDDHPEHNKGCPIPALVQQTARVEALGKGDVDELMRLLGLAQANPDLVDVDLWNEQVDAALAAQE